jgi:hypothetical protein
MKTKLLLLFFLFWASLMSNAQTSSTISNEQKVYTKAITDFIKAANKKNKKAFDTLFFLKRNTQAEDKFPNVILPARIEHTAIQIISDEIADKEQKQIPTRVSINLFKWDRKTHIEFLLVVFSNGFEHQYDYHVHYKYNSQSNTLTLIKSHF